MSILKFTLIDVALMALLILAGFLLKDVVVPPGSLGFVIGAILLSGCSGLLAYIITFSGLEKKVTMFMTYVMGGMLAKMFIGLMTIMIIAMQFEEFVKPFVLTYFFCYFIFTSFEVYSLMRKLRAVSNKEKRNTHEDHTPS